MNNNLFLICMMKDDEPKLLHHWLKYYFDFLKIPLGEVLIHRTNKEKTQIVVSMLNQYNINIDYTDSYSSNLKNTWINNIKKKYNENYWVVYPDSDEFFEYPDNNLIKFINYCEENKMTIISGYFCDRHSDDWELKEIEENKNIFIEYPIYTNYTKEILKASNRKITLFKNKYTMYNSHYLKEEVNFNNERNCKKERFKKYKQYKWNISFIMMSKKENQHMNTIPLDILSQKTEDIIKDKINIDELYNLILDEKYINTQLFIIDLSILNENEINIEYNKNIEHIIEEIYLKRNKNVIFIQTSNKKINEKFEKICELYLKPIIYETKINENFGENLLSYLFKIQNFLLHGFNYYYPNINVNHFKYTEYFIESNTIKVEGKFGNQDNKQFLRPYKLALENIKEKNGKYYLEHKNIKYEKGTYIDYI